MNREECGRLFSVCAEQCAKDALLYLYRGLYDACGGDPDLFFRRLHETGGVEGTVTGPGREYELIFTDCSCDPHTKAGMNSPGLCECSGQSILRELKELTPLQDPHAGIGIAVPENSKEGIYGNQKAAGKRTL